MKNPAIFIMILTFSIQLYSQPNTIDEFHTLQLQNIHKNTIPIDQVEGSPYSNKELIPGTIVFAPGRKMENVVLRYNWYDKMMEIQYAGSLMAIPPSNSINHVMIGDKKFVPFYYLNEVRGYLIQLYEGTCSLYMEEDIRFIDAQPAKSGYEQAQPPRFVAYSRKYYAIFSDGRFFELRATNKKLPLQFPDRQDEIASLIKDNKLNVKDEGDLIELFQRIDPILRQ